MSGPAPGERGDAGRAEFFREARSDRRGPIHDVRVLECTTTWAGPMAGCVLADLGADVIKVELPEGEVSRRIPPLLSGEGSSFVHETVNRNKRGLTLDLRKAEGVELFLDAARTADVVLENFLPGTMARWGVGYEAVRAVKPDIVYVSISGWGQFGPWRDRVGYDPIVQAASGIMSLNASPNDLLPNKVPTWLCDDLSGVHAALSALAALRHRDACGEGQHVDVAMLDAAIFQSNAALTLAALGEELKPWGSQIQTCVPANAYRCADGRFVYTGVILETHWARLCALMGRPDLVDEPGWRTNAERIANRAAVDALVAAWCAAQRSQDLIATLLDAGLAVTPVREFADLVGEEQVAVRAMLTPTTLADGGKAPLVGPAAKFSRTPTRIRTPAPGLGQHTAEVLAELGVGPQRYEQLRLDGVV